MPRVSVEEVQEIVDTELGPSAIFSFIETASLWIDENLASVCTQLSVAMLKQIEKFLTAHLITMQDPSLISSTMGDVSESYQRDPQVNDYLRTAMALDPCGIIRTRWLMDKRQFKYRVGTGYAEDQSV